MTDYPLTDLGIDASAVDSLFSQICAGLRHRIVSGEFASGSRLPPTRRLAEELGVSRSTVVAAYDQLTAEGFIEGRKGAGTYVSRIGEIELPTAPLARTAGPPQHDIQPLRPFHPGQPDMRLFPTRQWAGCFSRLARDDPKALVAGGDPLGDQALRAQICRYLREWRGVDASPSRVIVTAGSGDALEMCFRALTGSGESVALENPCYPPLRWIAAGSGLQVEWLAIDRDGAVPPRGRLASMAVLTPSSQFPLGGAMPRARRAEFLNWATQRDSWIVEDDYDSEFRYAGRPMPAMAGLDRSGRVLYVGSFSKIFSGGLRMGFMVVPEHLTGRFAQAIARFGHKASAVPQRALADFMAEGGFYRHIRKVRRIYAERRAVLLSWLRKNLGNAATFEDHRAGMQIALLLDPSIDDCALSERAASHGVICPPLSSYHAAQPVRKGLLLGFCAYTPDEMHAAFGGLLRAFRETGIVQ